MTTAPKKISLRQYQADIEKKEAIERLQELAPKGSTIYGVVRHVSNSGMFRRISFYVMQDNRPIWLDGWIAQLGTFKRDPKNEGLRVSGTGMNMIFHVVYESAYQVWGDGYAWKHASL